MSETLNPTSNPRTTSISAAAPGGFWRRLAALILDTILIGIVGLIIEHLIRLGMPDADINTRSWLFGGITDLVGIVYFTIMWSSQRGQSIGYKALNIQLIKTDGLQIGVGTALIRAIVIYLSFDLLLIPAIVSSFMIGLGGRKRAIHDLIAGTEVVRT